MCLILKANGYGVGMVPLAKALQHEVEMLAVAHTTEALALRDAGISAPIFVIHASRGDFAPGFAYGVSDETTIDCFGSSGASYELHLHVDTGMGRLGCQLEDAEFLIQKIESYPNLTLSGLFSHLAAADDPDEDLFTHQQYLKFKSVFEKYTAKWVHLANSAGHLRFNFPGCNLARIGLALFTQTPVLRLDSHIVSIQKCQTGASVGYGRKWKNSGESKWIATLPFGYHDGLSPHFDGTVVIRGKKAAVVGGLCMDYMMVDVTQFRELSLGDPVEIFGSVQSIEEVALMCGYNCHQLLATIGPRIIRCYS